MAQKKINIIKVYIRHGYIIKSKARKSECTFGSAFLFRGYLFAMNDHKGGRTLLWTTEMPDENETNFFVLTYLLAVDPYP